ncbi:MAG: DUF3618 domain-containing protein, partial [Pyrinomonadaceae bacterium]
MAQRPGELDNIDKLDPVSTAAGAGTSSSLDKYTNGDPENDLELREMSEDSDNASEETEQIKAQIEETRSNMGETIDAIQDRLSFSNISEQVSEQVNNAIETAKGSVYEHVNNAFETAKDSAYDATVGKVVNFMKNAGNELSRSSVGKTAMENPLPLILIGLGAGLLAYNSFNKKQSKSSSLRYRSDSGTDYRTQNDRADYRTRTDYSTSRTDESNASMLSSAQEKLGNVKDSVSDAAATAYEGVSNTAGSAYESVANAASTTYSEAGRVAGKAYEKVGETYNQYLEEKPWAIGAVALVAGAAVGLAIPSTRYEGELMGEARYNLLSKAQDTAGDLVDKAKQVAAEAGRTITEEAKALTQDN